MSSVTIQVGSLNRIASRTIDALGNAGFDACLYGSLTYAIYSFTNYETAVRSGLGFAAGWALRNIFDWWNRPSGTNVSEPTSLPDSTAQKIYSLSPSFIHSLCLGDLLGRNRISVPGIIQLEWDDEGYCGLCYNYVSNRIGIRVDIDVDSLIHKGFQIVAKPQAGDLILYVDIPEKPLPANRIKAHHIGIVSAVDGPYVWIESKWGQRGAYLHRLEAVPRIYGNGVIYFRKC